jgi:hypothetical protein
VSTVSLTKLHISHAFTVPIWREETIQDTVDEIAQLTTATASDRRTVATLTTTNAKLATQLEAEQEQFLQLKDEIAGH